MEWDPIVPFQHTLIIMKPHWIGLMDWLGGIVGILELLILVD